MPSFCSSSGYAAALEDIPEIGATFGSSSPPYFSHSSGLTDLNMEVILTNRSLLTYLCSLGCWMISVSLKINDFFTCTEYSSQHTSWVSRAPVLILKLISLRPPWQRYKMHQQEHQWCQKYLHWGWPPLQYHLQSVYHCCTTHRVEISYWEMNSGYPIVSSLSVIHWISILSTSLSSRRGF